MLYGLVVKNAGPYFDAFCKQSYLTPSSFSFHVLRMAAVGRHLLTYIETGLMVYSGDLLFQTDITTYYVLGSIIRSVSSRKTHVHVFLLWR